MVDAQGRLEAVGEWHRPFEAVDQIVWTGLPKDEFSQVLCAAHLSVERAHGREHRRRQGLAPEIAHETGLLQRFRCKLDFHPTTTIGAARPSTTARRSRGDGFNSLIPVRPPASEAPSQPADRLVD